MIDLMMLIFWTNVNQMHLLVNGSEEHATK